ncbi:MAG: hypothetical protein CME43_14705 [Haliea sp.]|mgnify:CR=1 FL=1|uniref:carboxymuconolactone decarboxylase family protein n=1 Tax=Haliea sp. TaxID=1932666 RepID=UPI000C69724E|nr:hypothetical protein [Haliea sp.]MBM70716.1 hypothetical protein [Haliea sp.]|tara:strand:+ start:38910 stop:39371 length:462 start_codon:yes stop_codon:yes gene_type:complete
MNWIVQGLDREQLLDRLPAIGGAFRQLYESVFELPQVSAETLELCRLRLAQLHRSAADFALEECPVSAPQRAQLQDWPQSPLFSDEQRACLAFTEVYAMDCSAITDAQADAVKAHIGEEGLVALLQALGVFDGLIRLGLIWQAKPAGVRQHGQ